MATWLVTGGARFIGSNFVLEARRRRLAKIVNLDKLTYAGNKGNLTSLASDPDHVFIEGDIAHQGLVSRLLAEHGVTAVVNLAAESHVDRSITGPKAFIETNVLGTFSLLEACRAYYAGLGEAERSGFRFLHVSTDEVYGSLSCADPGFSETTCYSPNSPYSASKAASDHFVRAYHHTYGLPTLIINCSNNYGPYQFPEKLIPLSITKALAGESIHIYGDGKNIRDWLYVLDHVEALTTVITRGKPGEAYNVGGGSERANIDLVKILCTTLDDLRPRPSGGSYFGQVVNVADRPGHDRRYAVDFGKIARELGWSPRETLESGLRRTVAWYLEHEAWLTAIRERQYQGDRLGIV